MCKCHCCGCECNCCGPSEDGPPKFNVSVPPIVQTMVRLPRLVAEGRGSNTNKS